MEASPDRDRRQTRRLATTLPVQVEWAGVEGEIRRARGSTRDISRAGLYCFLEEPLAGGISVAFDVVFPAELTAGNPLKLRCQGRVLRSETCERRFGVAATIENFQVMDTPEPLRDSDRRAYARILPTSSLAVHYPGVRSVVRDLSLTGAFLEDERPFPVGRQVELQLTGNGLSAEVRVKAVVRRVEPQVGMAVEFIALSREANNLLRQMIEKENPRKPS